MPRILSWDQCIYMIFYAWLKKFPGVFAMYSLWIKQGLWGFEELTWSISSSVSSAHELWIAGLSSNKMD